MCGLPSPGKSNPSHEETANDSPSRQTHQKYGSKESLNRIENTERHISCYIIDLMSIGANSMRRKNIFVAVISGLTNLNASNADIAIL